MKRLVVVDNALLDLTGHNFEYCRSLCEAARVQGRPAVVLAHLDATAEVLRGLPAIPVFRHLAHQRFLTVPGLRNLVDPLLANLSFLVDLARALGDNGFEDDLLFVPNATYRQTFAIAAWLAARRKPASALLLFRYTLKRKDDSGGWQPAALLARLSLRLLEALAGRHRLRFLTDSHRLAEEYGTLTRLPMEVVPIPHASSRSDEAALPPAPAPGRPVRFVMLGEARDDKGFPLLVEALEALREPLARGELAVTVQCHLRPGYSGESLAARPRLEKADLPGVKLLTEPVGTEAYQALVAGSHAVLVPYRRAQYRSQTSGILTEALAAGRPVVVTAGTWMADQAERYGAGVIFEDADPADLARAILQAARDYKALAARAATAREEWLAAHTPEGLLEALVGEG